MKKLCKPILIKSDKHSDIINVAEIQQLFQRSKITNNEDLLNNLGFDQQLILISFDEDEKIMHNDKWIYICPVNGIDYDSNNEPIITNHIPDSINWFDKLHDKKNYHKVIATQEQLPPEYIQQFIEEYNRGEVKDVEVVMTWKKDRHGDGRQFFKSNPFPKLTNGFITINPKEPVEHNYNLLCNMQYYMEYCQTNGYVTPQDWLEKYKHYEDKKEPITYTEEEVYELFNSFRKDFPLHRGIQIMDYDLKEWFNNNKKK